MGRTTWIRAAAACAALIAAGTAHAQEKLELFSWWTSDGSAALQALVQLYNERFPDVAVTNAAAEAGPGVDAAAELRQRMLAGDPPDTFQVHGGQELIGTWVAANRMEDLTGFFRTQAWTNLYPRTFLPLLSSKGSIWSVPLAVNRTNVLWFIPSRLAQWGVQPPRTWDELLAACKKLRDAGVAAPLAAGDPSTLGVLWESAALTALGPAGWNEMWSGKLKLNDPRAVAAWDAFGAAVDFSSQDSPGLSWQQTMDMLVRGDAAFVISGDWAEKYLAGTLKLAPGKDFGWAPSPGTAGVFMASTDTFGYPRGVKHRPSILKWLMLVGSREGQDTFNTAAGSISPRLDSELSRYDPYGRSAAADWRKDVIVGSLVRGTAAPEGFTGRFAEAISVYLSSRSSLAAANAAQGIADQAGLAR